MKKAIFGIMGLLLFVVLVSGCTSQMGSKTYNANGVNFTYPADWVVNDSNNTLSGFTVIANVENSTKGKFTYFKVSKKDITSNVTLQESYNSILNSIKQNSSNKDIKEENFTVDGIKANLLEFNSNNSTMTTKNEYTLFEKNGNIYLTQYTESPYNAYDEGFSILNTLHIK